VLKVSIRAEKETAKRIKELFPSAKLKNGACELTLEGERPAEVALLAGEMLEKLRRVVFQPKDFKKRDASSARN